MANFDSKIFNPEVFLGYTKDVPDIEKDKLFDSGAIVGDPDIAAALSEQTGANFITRHFRGNLGGTPDNYNGATDITSNTDDTYEQGIPVVGRAHGFIEKDFSYDITGKVDFMTNVANKIVKWWMHVNHGIILSTLKGVFGVTAFSSHKQSVTAISATMGNDALQAALGDNKDAIVAYIMPSYISTKLENLQLLEYIKYTDTAGIQRNLNLGTWNGKLVLIDDNMPTNTVTNTTTYTVYALGLGAITFQDVGVKVPYEMSRDAKVNGGQDTLYTRERYAIAPYGFSWKKGTTIVSPTNAELETAANWELVKNTAGDAINIRAIPLVELDVAITTGA